MKTVKVNGTRKLITGERIPYVWHLPVVDTEFERVVFDGTTGLCIACGEEHENCEPDLRRAKCGTCGEMFVYGLEELLVRKLIAAVAE